MRLRHPPGRQQWAWLLLTVGALGTSPAAAQFLQYSPPGSVAGDAEEMEEVLQEAVRDAKWRAGRWYISPWIGLRDVGVVDSSDLEADEQLSASAGIGLRFYRPIGAEWTFAAHALPEFVWLEDRDQRRVNGRFGAGLFGNLGRLGVELSATRQDLVQVFSRQFEGQVNLRSDRGELAVDLDLGNGFNLSGLASLRRYTSLAERDTGAPDFGLLDRDETVLRSVLRYRTRIGLLLGVGVEDAEVDFERSGSRLSSSGTSPVVELALDGERLRIEADVALRELEPDDATAQIAYDDVTGRAQLRWRLVPPLELELFGRRELVYSVDPDWAYFEDIANGVGVRFGAGARLSIRLFVEQGENIYTILDPAAAPRRDDFDTQGLELRLQVGRVALVISGSQTDYQSSLSLFSRETTVLRGGIELGRKGARTWG